MGDLNAGEGNPAVRLLLERTGFHDTFRQLHGDATEVGTFHAFRGGGARTGEKIDYVLVSPEWVSLAAEIIRAERGGRYPSDHFPVTARLRLAVGP